MFKKGIVDAAKVTRSALQNAASIAAMVLTTETLITDIPEKEQAGAGGGHGHGGGHGLLVRSLATHSKAPASPGPLDSRTQIAMALGHTRRNWCRCTRGTTGCSNPTLRGHEDGHRRRRHVHDHRGGVRDPVRAARLVRHGRRRHRAAPAASSSSRSSRSSSTGCSGACSPRSPWRSTTSRPAGSAASRSRSRPSLRHRRCRRGARRFRHPHRHLRSDRRHRATLPRLPRPFDTSAPGTVRSAHGTHPRPTPSRSPMSRRSLASPRRWPSSRRRRWRLQWRRAGRAGPHRPRSRSSPAVTDLQGVKSVRIDAAVDGTVNVDAMGTGSAAAFAARQRATGPRSTLTSISRQATPRPRSPPRRCSGVTGELIVVDGTLVREDVAHRTAVPEVGGRGGPVAAAPSDDRRHGHRRSSASSSRSVEPTKGEDVACGNKKCYTVTIDLDSRPSCQRSVASVPTEPDCRPP